MSPASEIKLVEVYRATETTELFSLHRNAPSKKCPVGRVILKALHPVMDRARSALEDQLAAVTLEDIATDVARLGKFTIPVEW